jgi:hypothetical protein
LKDWNVGILEYRVLRERTVDEMTSRILFVVSFLYAMILWIYDRR